MSQQLAEGAYTVDPTAPTTTAKTLWAEGATLARVGPGQVQVTLTRPTNADHFAGFATLLGVATGSVTFGIDNTSDCIKTITSVNAGGTPVDVPFSFRFDRKG